VPIVEEMRERELFELEKKLIARYKSFRSLKPKPIRIVDNVDFAARVKGRYIEVSKQFLDTNPPLKEVENTLKHELIHCLYPNYGHSIEFYNLAKRLKVADHYTLKQMLFNEVNKSTLEGRIGYRIVGGEEHYYIRKKPSWKGLKDFCEDRCIPFGEALKTLREIYGLTRKELASKLKAKVSTIKRIEEDKLNETLYENEKILRKIFWAIVSKKR